MTKSARHTLVGDTDVYTLLSTTHNSYNAVQDLLIHRDMYTGDFNVDKRHILHNVSIV